jgi:DNA-binding NarL/FixJ family response regulator
MGILVYIIDEHTAVRRNLVRRLSATDKVQVVGDSGDALAALRDLSALHPDVLLMEVKMRRADGTDVCSRAAKLDDRLKVVVNTSHVDAEERRRVQQAGGVAYLLKDLDIPGLVERLRALTEGQGLPADDRVV